MNKKTYEKITRPIVKYRYGVRILKLINNLITGLVYGLYPALLIYLAFNRDIRFWKVFIVPAISFNIVTIFRRYNNSPRPYEILDIKPIIKKDTKGKSFPSRHVFSIFVIATSFYYINPPIGMALMAGGMILALIRVLAGVHFPRDVVVGALLGVLCAVVGFWVF